MFALSAIDDTSTAMDRPRVTLVSSVATARMQATIEELQREAMIVQVARLDVLEGPPSAPLYVVSFAVEQLADRALQFVTWAGSAEPRPGLIGIIEDGSGAHSEELLAAGFDDVMVTPISTRELVARVRAVHRRVHWKGTSNGRLRFGEITLDLYGRELWIGGKTITLTSIELAVMRELIKARGKPLSRVDLLDTAWGEDDLEVSERAVDNVILRIRRKLPWPELIETVRSVGFRLNPRAP